MSPKRITFLVSDEEYTQFRDKCQRERTSMSFLLVRAVAAMTKGQITFTGWTPSVFSAHGMVEAHPAPLVPLVTQPVATTPASTSPKKGDSVDDYREFAREYRMGETGIPEEEAQYLDGMIKYYVKDKGFDERRLREWAMEYPPSWLGVHAKRTNKFLGLE